MHFEWMCRKCMRCVKCEQEHENLLSKNHDTIQLLSHENSITTLRSTTIFYFILHMMVYRVINTKVIEILKIAKNLIHFEHLNRDIMSFRNFRLQNLI